MNQSRKLSRDSEGTALFNRSIRENCLHSAHGQASRMIFGAASQKSGGDRSWVARWLRRKMNRIQTGRPHGERVFGNAVFAPRSKSTTRSIFLARTVRKPKTSHLHPEGAGSGERDRSRSCRTGRYFQNGQIGRAVAKSASAWLLLAAILNAKLLLCSI